MAKTWNTIDYVSDLDQISPSWQSEGGYCMFELADFCLFIINRFHLTFAIWFSPRESNLLCVR